MLQQAFLSIKLSPRCHYEIWLKKKKKIHFRVFRWLKGFIRPGEISFTPLSPMWFMLRSRSISSTACHSPTPIQPSVSCEIEQRTFARYRQPAPVIPHRETLRRNTTNMNNVLGQIFIDNKWIKNKSLPGFLTSLCFSQCVIRSCLLEFLETTPRIHVFADDFKPSIFQAVVAQIEF